MKSLSLLLVLASVNYCSSCSGCVDLTDLTFDKIVKKFKTVLVKFDQPFPHGETHDAFSKLSSELHNKTRWGSDHDDLLIATVGIKDYGDYENKVLGERFGCFKLSKIKANYPKIKLFNNGDLENVIDLPINLELGSEKITTTQLYAFLRSNSKVYVQVPGSMKELDDLAEKFVQTPKRRQEILEETEAIIEKIEDANKKQLLKTYTSLMKGVIEKGDGFVKKQRERMVKLIKDKLSEKKIQEINEKLNIVTAFKFPEAPNVEKPKAERTEEQIAAVETKIEL